MSVTTLTSSPAWTAAGWTMLHLLWAGCACRLACGSFSENLAAGCCGSAVRGGPGVAGGLRRIACGDLRLRFPAGGGRRGSDGSTFCAIGDSGRRREFRS